MTTWMETFKKAQDVVEAVLRDSPETRSDDMKLIMAVWDNQGLHLDENQKHIFRMVLPSETITRARRKLQEVGKYRPNDEIYRQRHLLEIEVRNKIGGEHII